MKKSVIFFGILFCAMLILTGAPDEKVKLTSIGNPLKVADTEWTVPLNISKTGSFCNYPAVAGDEVGNVHAIWVQTVGKRQVFYNKGDRDRNWGVSKNLTAGEVRIGEGPWAEIEVDTKGNPQVIYSAVPSDNYEALMKRYQNGSWGGHENVSRTFYGGTAYPDLVIDRNNNDYYVFWQDDEFRAFDEQVYWQVLTRHMIGGEGKWIGGGVLPEPNNRAYSPEGGIDANGKIYIAYANRASGNKTRVFFTENANAKDWNTWAQIIDISGGTGLSFAYPQIAVDWAGNCYVLWMNMRAGYIEVYFRKRVDGKWKEIENLSNSDVDSEDPTIACNKETGEIYAAWEEKKKILLSVYSNGQWSEPMNMTDNNSQSVRPNLYVTTNGTIHLVFSDDRTGQWNIYHRSKMGRPPEPPKAPINVRLNTSLDQSVIPNAKTNLVKWNENPENEGIPREFYSIYRKQEGQNDNQFALLTTVPMTALNYEDTGLPTNIKHVYALSVTDSFEQESELSQFAWENAVYPPMSLGLETKINRVLFSQEKINYLSWGHNPLNDPVPSFSYNIYRKLTTEDNSQLVLIHTADSNTFSYMDRGLSFTDKYIYSITVRDSEGHETPKTKAVVGEEEDGE
jgi:hypothetical protein